MLNGYKSRGDIKHQRSYPRVNFKVVTTPYQFKNAEVGVKHSLKKYPVWLRYFLNIKTEVLNIKTGDHAVCYWPLVARSNSRYMYTIPERSKLGRYSL